MANSEQNPSKQYELPEAITEGARNNTIFGYGVRLKRAKNLSDGEIARILRETNAALCKPPMDEWEIEQIIRNVTNLDSGNPIGTGAPKNKELVEIDPELPAPKQAAKQLQAMFSSLDIISFVTKFSRKPDGKWAPTGKTVPAVACQIIDKLQHAETLDEVFPDYNKQAGILLCVNPTKFGSRKNEDVTTFRSALIEFDDIPKDEQIRRMLDSGLPILSMTDSGNKSIHAIVRVNAKDADEYTKRVKELHAAIENKYGSACDKANKNPSRLTRLAGAQRGGGQQTLLYTEVHEKASVVDFIKTAKKPSQGDLPADKPTPNEIGETLIAGRGACLVDGIPAILCEGEYRFGATDIFKAVLGINKNATSHFRKEVLSYIKLMAPEKSQADEKYIRFSNGILDVDSLELHPKDSGLLLLNEIPHAWNPEAKSELVDETFNGIAQGNQSIVANLWEMYGLAMYRGHDVSRMMLLQGNGANGKSTLLDTLKTLLGEGNCFSLPIHELGEKFQLVPAMGKLALIGDDISSDFVNAKACATMKKFVTGETVSDQYKGGDTFQFAPYATLIYSCNEIPRFADASFGFERRVHPIPLSASFTPHDEGYDPHLKQKLRAEECIEYAVVKAVEALRKCRATMELTPNELSAGMRAEVVQNNDFVKAFIADAKSKDIGFIGETNTKTYERFVDWCNRSGQEPISKQAFSKKLCNYEGLRSVSSNGGRTYFAQTT